MTDVDKMGKSPADLAQEFKHKEAFDLLTRAPPGSNVPEDGKISRVPSNAAKKGAAS